MKGENSTALRMVVATNVRVIRNKIGLTQERLAEEAGLHRTYIGSIERGERNLSIDNIEKIARALDVSPDALLKEGAR